MSSIIKLNDGAQAAYTNIMTTELNALANGNAIIGATTISNGTNFDMEAEFSFGSSTSVTPTGFPFIGLYLMPLNSDATSYGDGRFGSAAAGPPPSNYYVGYMGVNAAAGAVTGSFGLPFMGSRIILPKGTFKPLLYNQLGVAMAATGNVLAWRSTNRQVV